METLKGVNYHLKNYNTLLLEKRFQEINLETFTDVAPLVDRSFGQNSLYEYITIIKLTL
jgi:hypothetical protein